MPTKKANSKSKTVEENVAFYADDAEKDKTDLPKKDDKEFFEAVNEASDRSGVEDEDDVVEIVHQDEKSNSDDLVKLSEKKLEESLNDFKTMTSHLIDGDFSSIHQWINTVSFIITSDVTSPNEILQRGLFLISTVLSIQNEEVSNRIDTNTSYFIDDRILIIFGGIAIGYDSYTAPLGISVILNKLVHKNMINMYIHKICIFTLALSMIGLFNTHFIVSLYASSACLLYYCKKERCLTYFMFLLSTFMFDPLPEFVTWGICGYGIILTTNS